MTVNGVIAFLQLIGGVAAAYSGGRMLWQVRSRWRAWPVSALVVFGLLVFSTGLLVGHIAILRMWGPPFGWHAFGVNGYGTLARTVTFTGLACWLAYRVQANAILNDDDEHAVIKRNGHR